MPKDFSPYKLWILAIFFGLFYSCSTTKKVPEGKYLLQSNHFKIKDKPRKTNLGELNAYIKEKPNSKLLGVFPLKLWFYNLTNPELDSIYDEFQNIPDEDLDKLGVGRVLDSLYLKYDKPKYVGRRKWLGRFLHRNGEAPKLVDSIQVTKSALNLESYFSDGLGFFDAQVNNQFRTSNKKAKVDYQIALGTRAVIDSFYATIPNPEIRKKYEAILAKSKVKQGEVYNIKNFRAERDRLTSNYLESAYFKFNDDSDQIKFFIDSSKNGRFLLNTELKIEAEQKQMSDRPYRYEKIIVCGDSDFKTKNECDKKNIFSRQFYEGYQLRFLEESKFRPRGYTDLIVPKVGDLYSFGEEQKTKRKILTSDNFTLTDFVIDTLSRADSTLQMRIWLKPKKKYDLQLFFEGAYSEFLGFGVTPGISMLTRNVFQGGENLSFTLKGTVGTVASEATDNDRAFFNAYEISLSSKLKFPRLFFPINLREIIPKRWNPSSEANLGVSLQQNIGLGAIKYDAGLRYEISPSLTTSHGLSLFNTEFINNLQENNYFSIFSSDSNLFDATVNAISAFDGNNGNLLGTDYATQINNGTIPENVAVPLNLFYMLEGSDFANNLPVNGFTEEDVEDYAGFTVRYQRLTQDFLISSFFYDFRWNQRLNKKRKHPWYLYGKLEYSGVIPRVLDNLGLGEEITISDGFTSNSLSIPAQRANGFFNIPYSEFFRLDLDIRKQFYLSSKSSFVLRQFFGIVAPFGNSKEINIPFGRSFFAGGSNDIRAWVAYSLGPGEQSVIGDFSVENLKLTWNAEYRFNVLGKMNGALFADAGNIWSIEATDNLEDDPTLFRFDTFLDQIALGAGFGFRYDFTYLLLRLDLGHQLHDPSRAQNDRWRLREFDLFNPTFSFGINYPF